MRKVKNKDLKYYMSLKYPITMELFEENGEIRFGLQIPELEGVWADGGTPEEAYNELIETKRLWFETCLEKQLNIPEPISEEDLSGKFIVRLNPKLHMALRTRANRANVSLNQYVKTVLDKHVSNLDLIAEIKDLKQLMLEQSKSLEGQIREVQNLKHRMRSLEESFSSTQSHFVVTTMPHLASGSVNAFWEGAIINEESESSFCAEYLKNWSAFTENK